MARKSAQQEQTLPSGDGNTAIDLTGLETGDELHPALQRLYAEMGTDEFGKIKVYIYKLNAETGKEPRVWEGPPGDYDLMSVAKRFGSGDYRVKVYVPHESGRIVVGANTIFPILLDPAEDAKIVALREGKDATQLGGVVAPIAQPAITPESLAIAIASALKAAMPAPVDPFAQLDKVAGILQKIMPPAQAAQPAGNSFMDTLKATQALMELTNGMRSPIDAEGRVDTKGVAITRGIDLLTKMFERSLEQNQSAKPAVPAKQIVAPQSGEGEPATPEAPQLNQEQIEELEMLKLQIRMVNRQAKVGADVEKLAEEYYDELPQDIFDLIVFEPNWFAILCQNVPECAEYKDWYEKMRTAIIAKGLKDSDLKSNADGSLSLVEEGDTTPIA